MTDVITDPILREAKRLIDFYASTDADVRLTRFEIRPATADENPFDANSPDFQPCWVIESELGEMDADGDGEVIATHDESQMLTDSGTLLRSIADGVDTTE